MIKPVLLLDVDGVINANRPGWSGPPRKGEAYTKGRSWIIHWDSDCATAIRELMLGDEVDVRWATTWVEDVDQLESLFSFPQTPVAFHSEPDSDISLLKYMAALQVVETEKRPLIWMDDDVVPTAGRWLERLELADQPMLLIKPSMARGLRPEHFESVREFIDDIPNTCK